MAILKIEEAWFDKEKEIVYVTISSRYPDQADKEKKIIQMDMNSHDFFTYAGVTGRLKRNGKRKDDPILGDYIEVMVEDTMQDETDEDTPQI